MHNEKKLSNKRSRTEKKTKSIPNPFSFLITAATTPDSSKSEWREDPDIPDIRQNVVKEIVRTLEKKKPNAPRSILKKLLPMANRIEQVLYKIANSRDQYLDIGTLGDRLKMIHQQNMLKVLEETNPTITTPKLTRQQQVYLYGCVQSWREKVVAKLRILPSEVIDNRSIAKVVHNVPTTIQELSDVCAIDNVKVVKFGRQLLSTIQSSLDKLQESDELHQQTPLVETEGSNMPITPKSSVKLSRRSKSINCSKKRKKPASLSADVMDVIDSKPTPLIPPIFPHYMLSMMSPAAVAGNPATQWNCLYEMNVRLQQENQKLREEVAVLRKHRKIG